jgi:hypothetical protein
LSGAKQKTSDFIIFYNKEGYDLDCDLGLDSSVMTAASLLSMGVY